MPAWTELFGAELVTTDGNKPTEQVLADKKIVGIYFSAKWCFPCREFTPTLCATYDELMEKHSDVEIVFASSDRNLSSFQEYFEELPFLALPYENRDAEKALSDEYELIGIPTLVFLNGEGEFITSEGRQWVNDANGDAKQLYAKLTSH